jgi:uncharacterized membrane protein YhaH (DUF805 family)
VIQVYESSFIRHTNVSRHNAPSKGSYLVFHGRLNRKRYILRKLALWMVRFVLGLLNAGSIIHDIIKGNVVEINPASIFYLLFSGKQLIFTCLALFLWIVSLSLTVRRLHDLEYSGWYYFALLIPLVHLYFWFRLVFCKGTTGPNRFGPDPLMNGH